MDISKSKLIKYFRESFPEYSKLTLSEIFAIRHVDSQFMNEVYSLYDSSFRTKNMIIKDLFFLDWTELFKQYKDKYFHDFIEHNCFTYSFDFNSSTFCVNYKLPMNNSECKKMFFTHDLTNKEITISYNNKTIKYTKKNLDKIIFKCLEFITKNNSINDLFLCFLDAYIQQNTDLMYFFNINLLKDNTIVISEYDSKYVPSQLHYETKKLQLCHQNNIFYILDGSSNILLKKDLKSICKDNFFNEIIKPFKNIVIDFDNLEKKYCLERWKEDFYHNISAIISKKHLNAVTIQINFEKNKSIFLNKIIYSKRPIIEMSFILNNEIISHVNITNNAPYLYQNDEICAAYESYKKLLNTQLQKIQIEHIMNEHAVSEKRKRI